MRVHRIRLGNYRGVNASEVSFATDGVTIIEGDNEVGKTSIAEALRLILRFQDSSRHRDVSRVQPEGRDVGAEVEVELTTGPYRFVYSKRWHRQPQTTLEVAAPCHEQLTGRQAHDRAEEILKETLDEALWDALRIDQGTELSLPDFDVSSLGRALDVAAAGGDLGDQDDDLWNRICAERERYWTPVGRPRGDRKDAENLLDEARRHVADVERQLADIASDAAEVERRVIDRGRLEQCRDAAERDEQALGERCKELERLEGELARLTAEHQAAVQKRDRVDSEATRRNELIQGLAGAEGKVRELQAAGERSMPVLAAAVARDTAAAEELAAAAASLETARVEQKQANEDRDHHRRLIEVEQLRERHGRVVEAQKALAEAEAHLEAARVDDELLGRIEAANLEVVGAEASAKSAAATLVVTALADLEMTVSGEAVELPAGSDREFTVANEARLTLPGVVRVDVTAGGGSQGKAVELQAAEARLAQLCEQGGVSGFEEARRAAKQRAEAERARDDATRTINRDQRDLTVDVLAQKIVGLSSRIEAYAAERPADPALPSDFEEAKQRASAAEKLLTDRDADHTRCRQAAAEANEALATARQEEAVKAARVHDAEVAKGEAQEALAAARRERPDADLRASLASAQQAFEGTKSALGGAQAAVEEADPGSLKLLVDNARAAAARAVTELEDNEGSLRTLLARLEVQGESGLHEQLSEARSHCERLERDHERAESRAQAAQLLHATFERRRAESRRRYLAPFKERIERFGRIVFGPTFEVELDDDLRLARRTLEGTTLEVEQLSVGAREQLGVLARLACAAIVSPDGGGAPVVLDDALGWSDPGRLARMGAAIAAAGRECQVIVLTCTPGRYAHVGNAKVVTLPD